MHSIVEFWRLAVDSRLLSREHAQRLAGDQADDPPTDAAELAERLVQSGAISRYHADTLLAGKPGPFWFGPYKILAKCPPGRLAGLYRATHAASQFEVLLQFVQPPQGADPRWRREMIRWVRAAERIDDEHVSRTFEMVAFPPAVMIVLENLRGMSLAQRLADGAPFEEGQAAYIARRIARGLAAIQEHRLPHGLIAPENIWLPLDEQAKLLQFPLAPSPTQGVDPARRGAPASYLAPELAARTAQATASGDIYALGCVLVEMLAGLRTIEPDAERRGPRRTARSGDWVRRALKECDDISTRLFQVVARMTAQDPAMRYAEPVEVVDALADLETHAMHQTRPILLDDPPARLAFDRYLEQSHAARPPDDEPAEVSGHARTAGMTGEPLPYIQTSSGESGWADGGPPTGVFQPSYRGGASAAVSPPRAARPLPPPLEDEDDEPLAHVATLPVVLAGLVGIVGIAALVVLIVYLRSRDGDGARPPAGGRVAEAPDPFAGVAASPRERIVADDGRTLWASPTSGGPIRLQYLPAGAEWIVLVRGVELAAHDEWPLIVAALGPTGQRWLEDAPRVCGLEVTEIDRLVVAWSPPQDAADQVSLVVSVKDATKLDRAGALWRDGEELSSDGETYYLQQGRAFWRPRRDEGRVLCVLPPEAIRDVIAAGPTPPPLRREMEEMLAATDEERQVTALFAPRIFLTSATEDASGLGERLRDGLASTFGDDVQAALVSAHLTKDDLFLELRATGTLDAPGYVLVERFRGELSQMDDLVESALAENPPPDYAGRIVRRLPEMLRFLNRYTRADVVGSQAVLRAYAPARAAHNLLFATELHLGLDASPRGAGGTGGATAPAGPKTLAEVLKKRATVAFPRDTLEKALELLSAEIQRPIVLLGSDLQSEGITRNQSFAIDQVDQPAEEVLVEILRLANPDKTASGPADPKQKLIYVIRPAAEGQPESIAVTTRGRAESRGDAIPTVFTAGGRNAPADP